MDRNRRWFSVSLSGLSIGWLGMVAAFLPFLGAYKGFALYIDLNTDVTAVGAIAYSAAGFFAGLAGTGIFGLLFEIHEDLSAIREFSVGRLPKNTTDSPLFSGRRADDPLSKIEKDSPPKNTDDGP